ncbi:hypothetical protein GCM10025868_08660 [Angustibacter aerolatus]|uniref:Uncharacterized protein n=1 Tax=Angustibacter aerolatus TaxID=1162965 RepID=A0ABQ6JBR4_9ACTN|nr:hypothetical protein GCM10025868_08660 [Angustibacter aerolatus]
MAWTEVRRGRTAQARERLLGVLEASRTTDRLVWEIGALSMLAEAELAEHGDHPASRWFAESRRLILGRLWWERASRFAALRDRMSLRALAAEATQAWAATR